MIVVMANIAQKHGPIGDVGEFAGFLKRKRFLGSPPRIIMTAVIAAKPRAAPAAIDALCRLIVHAAGIDGKPLQQKRGSTAD